MDRRYQDTKWLMEQYEKKSVSEIADMCNVSESCIYKWLDHEPDKYIYRNKCWLWKKYYDENLSLRQIADEVDVDHQTILDNMRKHDIPRR